MDRQINIDRCIEYMVKEKESVASILVSLQSYVLESKIKERGKYSQEQSDAIKNYEQFGETTPENRKRQSIADWEVERLSQQGEDSALRCGEFKRAAEK